MDSFLLVGVGICKLSFTSQRPVLVDLAQEPSESAERVASFGNEAAKELVMSEVSNSGVWRARPKQLISDSCSAKENSSRSFSAAFAFESSIKFLCAERCGSEEEGGGYRGITKEAAENGWRMVETAKGILEDVCRDVSFTVQWW